MITKILNIVKYLLVVLFIFISIISCEKDFENIGVDLVNNNNFSTPDTIFELISYSKNVDSSRTDNLANPAFGIYQKASFGLLKAAIISQVGLPSSTDFGTDPSIDAVYLDIPYDVVKAASNLKIPNEETSDDPIDSIYVPDFTIQNIYGNKDVEFEIKVSQLNTFLNSLDPLDPTKPKKYYSNKTYDKLAELYSGNFKADKTDSILFVRRLEFDTQDGNGNIIENYDTIKNADTNGIILSPSIRLELDKLFFETNFVDEANESHFSSLETFILHFKGILLEANGIDGAIMNFPLAKSNINIYYTNTVTVTKNEVTDGVDYNGDGDILDESVEVDERTKQTMTFPLGGIQTNMYERDYTDSPANEALTNPNTTIGEKKLYIQGAQGSMAVLDIFNSIDLEQIRNENWLINEASLTFYVDQDASENTVPNRLFLYKLDKDLTNNINENTQILDVLTEADSDKVIYGGYLQKDDDDNAEKYKFNITDYISELLKKEDAIQPSKFAIKTFHPTDLPIATIPNDTIVRDFSWNPKGIVLYGNDYLESDPDYNKRVRLEVYYSKAN